MSPESSLRVLERSWVESYGGESRFALRHPTVSDQSLCLRECGNLERRNPFVLVHLRYHFQQFTEHKFELALSVPLAHGFAIDVGTAYQFGRETEQRQMVLKLSKQMRNGGILYVGMEAQQRPTFLVGVALPL